MSQKMAKHKKPKYKKRILMLIFGFILILKDPDAFMDSSMLEQLYFLVPRVILVFSLRFLMMHVKTDNLTVFAIYSIVGAFMVESIAIVLGLAMQFCSAVFWLLNRYARFLRYRKRRFLGSWLRNPLSRPEKVILKRLESNHLDLLNFEFKKEFAENWSEYDYYQRAKAIIHRKIKKRERVRMINFLRAFNNYQSTFVVSINSLLSVGTLVGILEHWNKLSALREPSLLALPKPNAIIWQWLQWGLLNFDFYGILVVVIIGLYVLYRFEKNSNNVRAKLIALLE